MIDFVLHKPAGLEESLTCEFKEVKAQPVQAVGNIVDEYVVAFLNASGGSIFWGIRDSDGVVTGVLAGGRVRDELRQVIGQKVSSIAPAVPSTLVEVPFHPVRGSEGPLAEDMCVLEVRVQKPENPGLFLTGKGEAYRRTFGGTKRLSGAELFLALAHPLQAKVPAQLPTTLLLNQLPNVHRRAMLVESIVRGRRVLWVDDNPSNNFYERVALAEIGVNTDVAVSSDEGLQSARYLRPHVIVSDIARSDQRDAGLTFLSTLRAQGIDTPVIFYVGTARESFGIPRGAFAITDRPDELLHSVLDVLERGGG